MEEEFKKKKKKLLKEYVKSILPTLFLFCLCQTISSEGMMATLLIAELGLRFLNVENPFRILFLGSMQSFLILAPSICSLYCVNHSLIEQLKFFKELATLMESRQNDNTNTQTNTKTNYMNLSQQEEEVKQTAKKDESYQNIIARFNALPREKKMELLNYVKGLETSSDIDLANQINNLDKEQRDLLQTSMEDKIFKSYDELFEAYKVESGNGFSRKRTRAPEKKDSTTSTD